MPISTILSNFSVISKPCTNLFEDFWTMSKEASASVNPINQVLVITLLAVSKFNTL